MGRRSKFQANAVSYKQSPDEMAAAFHRTVRNMRRSSAAYDQGHLEEAENLANHVYKLCASSRGHQLLAAMNIRHRLNFPDTIGFLTSDDPSVVTAGPPLCAILVEDGSLTFIPRFGSVDRMPVMRFKQWWHEQIFRSPKGGSLTRETFCAALRNQDGGAHVDGELDQTYARFSREGDHMSTNAVGSITLTGIDIEGRKPLPGHFASMRQIAWEIDMALMAIGIIEGAIADPAPLSEGRGVILQLRPTP